MNKADIGIIGGSGFYDLATGLKEIKVETPYGSPSDKIALGKVAGHQVAFLPRHHKDHNIPPHKINYRANIYTLKSLGVSRILADRLKTGMVMVRKKGKLPYKTEYQEFDLEYGQGSLEIHQDSIKKGERVLLVDDVLATGGTMLATAKLVEKLKGKIVGIAFLIVLDYLPGREKLKKYSVFFLVNYE